MYWLKPVPFRLARILSELNFSGHDGYGKARKAGMRFPTFP
jgi:hypothetical protein